MTQKIYEQGDVKVSLLEIKSRSNGGKLQALDQIKGVFIYEDMTQPTMMAEFKFDDNINMLHDLPLIGEEDITIEFSTPGLRPVLLTALTAVLGLIPLAIGLNFDFFTLVTDLNPHFFIGGDNVIFWGPLAWTIIFGLTYATVLTLVMVPVMFYLVKRTKYWLRDRRALAKVNA